MGRISVGRELVAGLRGRRPTSNRLLGASDTRQLSLTTALVVEAGIGFSRQAAAATIAILILSGCTVQNLVGNLNVGLGGADSLQSDNSPIAEQNQAIDPDSLCYRPLPSEAKAELSKAGWTRQGWPAFTAWLDYQGQTIRPALGDCDETQAREDRR